ncbi:MAG: hypothetical protein WD740_04000 [Anaerolineales bacterium]
MTNKDPIEQTSRPGSRGLTIVFVILGLALLVGLGAAILYLLQPDAPTEGIRDIFIILVAFEFMIIGLALILLLVQLARLINMLNNEVRPILDSASEAAKTMRGTSRFISDKLVAPIVSASAGIAGFRRALDLLKFWGRK